MNSFQIKDVIEAIKHANDLKVIEVEEDGLYFVDANMNVGVSIDGDGLHAINVVECKNLE